MTPLDYETLPYRIQSIYNTCSDEEKGYLIQILQELSDTGESPTYETLWLQDYVEIPVDLDTFLCEDEYLGLTNRNGDAVYPYWKIAMHDIFDAGNQYHECIFTGATRIGKTSTAITCTCYMLYRLMCLRDPQKFFNKKEVSKFTISFFNVTKDLAMGVAFREFNDTLKASPWFNKHGHFSKSEKNFYYIPDGGKIEIGYGSEAAHALGQQIYVGFMDEINFAKAGVKDINKAKQRMKELYDSVVARVEGTFRQEGEVFGKIFAVSSKKTDSDFMEDHVESQMSAGNKHMIVFDKPQWEVLPASQFNPERFWIAVGDRHHKGFVLTDESEEARNELIEQGYRLLEVPLDMKSNFLSDFDISLRDLAGIAVPGALSFITQDMIDKCIGGRPSPFYQEVLEIGIKDTYTIEEFFHKDKVSPSLMKCPLFLDIDLSLNDDKTGISGVVLSGRKDIKSDDGKILSLPSFSHIFSIDIKAPRGDKIPYAKITSFILWLRRSGFDIERISRDQFQSEYMAQLLESEGFTVDKLSVDTTPDGYLAFRDVLMDERIDLLDHKTLQDELIRLQRDGLTDKIDHPPGGCFTQDTLIQLVDGRSISIHDLMLEQQYKTNYVYTINESTLKIEPKKIRKVFQTKLVTDLLEVELDNGEIIHCTPEHRFMVRDGHYEEIQNLSVGDSLMPLYIKLSEEGLIGYRLYYEPMEDKWHYEHRQFCDYTYEKGYVVHHKNFNKLNNCPDNLEYISKSKHKRIHNNSTLDYSKVSDGVRRYHSTHRTSSEYIRRNMKISAKIVSHYDKDIQLRKRQAEDTHRIQEIERIYGVIWDNLTVSEKNSFGGKYARLVDPSIKERRAKSLSQRHLEGCFENATKALSGRRWITNGVENQYPQITEDFIMPEGYQWGRTISKSSIEKMKQSRSNMPKDKVKELKQRQSEYTSSLMWITDGEVDKYVPKTSKIPEGFRRGRCKLTKNHSIVRITRIHKPCKVYDLEIEDNPNFALAAGVFVHNSKDISDSLARATWNAILRNEGLNVDRKSVASTVKAVNRPKIVNDKDKLATLFPDLYKYNRRKR